MGVALDSVNVIAELERLQIKFEFAGGDEVKVPCPFHDDHSPSCHINTVKRYFKCQTASCEAHGDFVSFLSRQLTTSRAAVLIDLGTRYDIETDDKVIDALVVERWHENIWNAGVFLNELHKRGVTDELIRKYRLGENDKRITIPIRNASGYVVNVRKYLPGAAGAKKMQNTRGHAKPRWFPIDQLKYKRLLITGGECKAIVAADQLNKYDIGVVTGTHGEQNLPPELMEDLRGKEALYWCLDIDAAGQLSAAKQCAQGRMYCEHVYNIVLPLDPDKHPKGDINDFVATEKGELWPLIDNAKEFELTIVDKLVVDTSEPVDLDLNSAIHADNSRSRLRVSGIVSAMDTTPYIVPKDVIVNCDKDANECFRCPVVVREKREFQIPPECVNLVEFVGAPNTAQPAILKDAIGIPMSCRVCTFTKVSEYNVEDTRISPALDSASRSQDRQPVPALCISDNGKGMTLNEGYELTGKLVANPKNQQATLLISKCKPSQDALSSYTIGENINELGVFWPNDWSIEEIHGKLTDIYTDFACNVTGIYERQNMHLIADLAYHSALHMTFDGRRNIKAWVEALILGDTSQGKSEVCCGANGQGGLMKHYGLGHKMECKNATVAGVLGGMEKMGERWFVSWGVMPTHDRRLVILEEVKGMSTEVIGKLTDMRSSGMAELAKIGRNWKTNARTRQIWVTNAKFDMPLAGYTYGLMAIKEVMGAMEDIRRLDIAFLAAKGEANPAIINRKREQQSRTKHLYTSKMCRELVLWCWTRTQDEIEWAEGTIDTILAEAISLSETFNEALPLIDRGSIRFKLARLSIALAGRLFSCSPDFTRLIVYPTHVQYIANLLRDIYGSQTFGYADFSKAMKALQQLLSPEILKLEIEKLPFPREFCKHLLSRDFIELKDIEDWAGVSGDTGRDLVSVFVRKNAFARAAKGAYRKSPAFIEFLKALTDSDDLNDRPSHIPEEKF